MSPDVPFELVYSELHGIARRLMAKERASHTLQATALVHEAFLKLESWRRDREIDRVALLSLAAPAMRQILVDHARAAATQKRKPNGARITASLLVDDSDSAIDLIDLHDVLERLASLDERKARVVEMRIFAEMTIDEVATALAVAPSTVSADWRTARAWVAKELDAGPTDAAD